MVYFWKFVLVKLIMGKFVQAKDPFILKLWSGVYDRFFDSRENADALSSESSLAMTQCSKYGTRAEEIEKCGDKGLEPTYYLSIFTRRIWPARKHWRPDNQRVLGFIPRSNCHHSTYYRCNWTHTWCWCRQSRWRRQLQSSRRCRRPRWFEMLMVRKPCNCKIRLSHIKQIAIANQTSIVATVVSEQMVIIMAGI